MAFRILGLDPAPFRPLYGLSEEALARSGVRRVLADAAPGFPDRIELRDVEAGAPVLLLNHLHQPAETPYRSSHAIFVREGAERACDLVDEVPSALRLRMISLRAFDASGWMLDADLAEGTALEPLIAHLFVDPNTAYLQAHFAKRGCYAARIERT